MAEFISLLRANPLTSMLFGLVTATFVKGSLLLLLTFTVVLVARRLAANQKHIIWFVVIVFLILTPICWLTLPPLGLNVAIPAYQSETIELMTAPLNSLDQFIEQVVLSDDLALKYDLFSTKGFLLHRAPWPSIMLGVWSVGIGVFFLRLFVGRRAVNRFIRGARKCSDQRSRAILEKLMDIFKLNQKIDLMHSRLCNIQR